MSAMTDSQMAAFALRTKRWAHQYRDQRDEAQRLFDEYWAFTETTDATLAGLEDISESDFTAMRGSFQTMMRLYIGDWDAATDPDILAISQDISRAGVVARVTAGTS